MTTSEPLHIALIPDGNRRWAKQHGLSGYKTLYDRGVSSLLDITQAAFDSGVTHLSLWGSSHANLADRSGDFFSNIDQVFRDNVHRFADHPVIDQYDVRINVIGEWRDSLTPDTVAAMKEAIARTAHRRGRQLTLLIDYSGSRERAAAFLAASAAHEAPQSLEAAAESLRAHSWTFQLPEVDLIIRTGSWQDPHNSAGFLSLLADEAQYAFPEVLWPDFTPARLTQLIDDFRQRERRRGK